MPPARAAAPSPASAPQPAARVRAPAPAPSPRRAAAGEPLLAAGPAVKLTAARTARPTAVPAMEGGGDPLPGPVLVELERSLRVDLRRVRVHTDPHAHELAKTLSARAVTYGHNIFLGSGERPTDLALIGHEVAHVVQQQAAPRLQAWSAGSSDAYEREAHQTSAAVVRHEAFTVQERTSGPRVQRLGISDVLDYFADKANNIPGFRMFTIVLGVNPINMRSVDRSAANILRAIIEFIPGGNLITQALDNHGIFDKVGNWIEGQIKSLGMVGSAFKQAISDFIDSLGWRDIFRLGSVWSRAKRIFTDPIDKLISFGKGFVTDIIKFIKDAILKPLAALAEGTPAYDLLKAVLGEDPITGEKVAQDADALIGGFMKMIGQQEIYNNIKKANALGRAWAWFKGALSGLLGFVRQIPSLFIAALTSLELLDIVLVPRAFVKVGRVFASFFAKFFSWAGEQVMSLLQIIFEVVAPGAVPYIKKAAGAFKTIIKNPIGFIGNLVKAGVKGFKQFASKFLTHLKKSLIDWLTGTLPSVYIPKSFEFLEIVRFVLSVLGLTWQNIRAKLVKAIGEPAVKAFETGFDIVVTLVTKGPAAAWDKIKEAAANLKQMVMDGIMDFVKWKVVEAAVTKLLTSLNPVGAFIQAIIAIYNTIMFFVERLKQIAQVAMAFIDSIAAIASGAIGQAANKVETTMAGFLTLVISFLARFAGLGKVSDAVMKIINAVRNPIDKGLDRVVAWIVAMAKKLGKFIAQAGVPQDPKERLRLAAQASVAAARRLSGRVSKSLLGPVLSGIKLRYGLTVLEPYEQGGVWWVRGEINPVVKQSLGVSSTAATQPAAAGAGATGGWPVAPPANVSVRKGKGRNIWAVVSINPDDSITLRDRKGGGTQAPRRHAFMERWQIGDIRPAGESAAELREYLTSRWGVAVANAILKRGDLAKKFVTMDDEEAHHIIPVEILGRQEVLRLLVQSGWDFNAKINGVPLAEGFHGNHPKYRDYVDRRINEWMAQYQNKPVADVVAPFKTFLESVLIPEVLKHIMDAKRQFATTGKNLNAYFSGL